MEEVVHARGHENVSAEHASTFEVTTDDYLTPAGDCILAIDADRAPSDFSREFVDACQDTDSTITVVLETPDERVTITGSGHPDLAFENQRGHVGRTSTYVDDRTIMVDADAAAADLPRDFVTSLADGAPLTMALRVE
ncbi:DUF371 domain-containing protein [Salarchaeum sp. JOR-1]|uniref:DUF371 domain-containing protein n=1 Tax=Salarchaeum sp. JOR-1 TaxID=2599399 RepID=UPI0011983963|nr:DUF371 domain-containing protein [Salarchaeum sp. JOR-1]QDX39684.1 DUF371 domain-containing protein [Salarchaeum sp. JOR-1]